MFESVGRFIELKCHNYALFLCFVYELSNTRKHSYATLSRIMLHIYIYIYIYVRWVRSDGNE